MSPCTLTSTGASRVLTSCASGQRGKNWVLNLPALRDMLSLNTAEKTLLDEAAWSEIAIVSCVTLVSDTDEPPARVTPASGDKCARCWRVLREVGSKAAHPSLCLRCTDAVESGLVSKPAA